MKIKIIPENDAEKRRFQEKFGSDKIEHTGVKEYFIFGNKFEKNASLDFHEWTGSYRYLLSSLSYFYEIVNDQRKAESKPSNMEILNPDFFNGENDIASAINASKTRMVKRGEGGKITPIDFKNLTAGMKQEPKIVQFSPDQIANDAENFEDRGDVNPEGGQVERVDEGFDDDIPTPPERPNIAD